MSPSDSGSWRRERWGLSSDVGSELDSRGRLVGRLASWLEVSSAVVATEAGVRLKATKSIG